MVTEHNNTDSHQLGIEPETSMEVSSNWPYPLACCDSASQKPNAIGTLANRTQPPGEHTLLPTLIDFFMRIKIVFMIPIWVHCRVER